MTIIQQIKKANNILVVSHIRPDGDCIGSGLTMRYIAKSLNKNVDFVTDSEKPANYNFLEDYETLNDIHFSNYDLLIAVDCADDLRLGKYANLLNRVKMSINIDHHKTNNRFAKENYVVPTASSACEVIYSLIKDEFPIDKHIATWLFVGMSTDTGHFMHSNTSSTTLKYASELMSYDLPVAQLTDKIYKNNTKNKVILIGKALNNMRFYHDDEICIITITSKMLKECGCVMSDTEGIIDYGMTIGSVNVCACMTQQSQNSYKVSFRSKNIDVAAAAGVFGGGGHKLAAGCVVNGLYEDVVDKILKSITDGI